MKLPFSKLKNSLTVFGLLMLAACAGVPDFVPRHVFIDQILTPRRGMVGLTNRACSGADEKGACKGFDIVEYKLDDEQTRKDFNTLGFICNIGGRRFKVCMDKPGFCRISYKKKCTLGIVCHTKLLEEYLPVADYEFLLKAKTRCFQKDTYPFDTM